MRVGVSGAHGTGKTTLLLRLWAAFMATAIRRHAAGRGPAPLLVVLDCKGGSDARKIADRIAMLYKGKIIWHGPVADIDNSGNPYVDQFIHGRAEGPIKMEVKA